MSIRGPTPRVPGGKLHCEWERILQLGRCGWQCENGDQDPLAAFPSYAIVVHFAETLGDSGEMAFAFPSVRICPIA